MLYSYGRALLQVFSCEFCKTFHYNCEQPQRRIQNPANIYFCKKLYLRCLTGFWICYVCFSLKINKHPTSINPSILSTGKYYNLSMCFRKKAWAYVNWDFNLTDIFISFSLHVAENTWWKFSNDWVDPSRESFTFLILVDGCPPMWEKNALQRRVPAFIIISPPAKWNII